MSSLRKHIIVSDGLWQSSSYPISKCFNLWWRFRWQLWLVDDRNKKCTYKHANIINFVEGLTAFNFMCFLQSSSSHTLLFLSLDYSLLLVNNNKISSASTKTVFKTILLTLQDNYSSTPRAHLKAIEHHTM